MRSDRTETASTAKNGPKRSGGGASRQVSEPDAQVGTVLRTVYQQTVEEDIPAEMLDLLRKLD